MVCFVFRNRMGTKKLHRTGVSWSDSFGDRGLYHLSTRNRRMVCG
ncbi:hypothetical protein [Rubritalea tangerina]